MNEMPRAPSRDPRGDALSRLDPRRLEALLAAYYRDHGYRVVALPVSSGADDNDILLKLYRDDAFSLLQCKHGVDKPVPQNVVSALIDVTADQRADGAILATSGEFTPSAARAAAQAKTMRLVDGAELRKMLAPLLTDEDGVAGDDAFAESPVFVDADAASPFASQQTSSATPTADTSESSRRAESGGALAAAEAPPFDVERDGPIAAAKRRAKSPSLMTRLNRPASAGPIGVAAVLLSMIVLTIVFRDRLDPYKYLIGMREPPPPVAPKDESPLAGTTYKSAVFEPKIEVSKDPTPDAPFSRRPIDIPPERPPPSPDQAIRVIERSTPDVGAPLPEAPRKKSDAKGN